MAGVSMRQLEPDKNPEEAHVQCVNCSLGALMMVNIPAGKDNVVVAPACYLHAIEMIVAAETAARNNEPVQVVLKLT